MTTLASADIVVRNETDERPSESHPSHQSHWTEPARPIRGDPAGVLGLLEALEGRGIRLSLARGEVRADFDPGALTDSDREWIKRFQHDLTRVLRVRAAPPPIAPMPEPRVWRDCVASWPEPWRQHWAELVLDYQLAGFDPDESEWRSFIAITGGNERIRM